MSDIVSVCTATYNRVKTLKELYNSLKNQTDKRFEWIIIDDDSQDDTEKIVSSWQVENNDFEIHYCKQVHGGKHRAINKAVKIAKGNFVFIVDSDDRLFPKSIEFIQQWIKTCQNDDSIAAVAGLKVDSSGEIWGGKTKIDKSYIDASNFERTKYKLNGDKAEVYRKDLLEKFSFPEFENEFFVTEDVCWLNIAAAGYKIRWFNEPIYEAEYLDDGLSKTGANDMVGHINNFKGYCYYISECIKKKPFTDKMLHARDYEKTCNYIKIGLKERATNLDLSIMKYLIICYIGIPVGYIIRKVRKY